VYGNLILGFGPSQGKTVPFPLFVVGGLQKAFVNARDLVVCSTSWMEEALESDRVPNEQPAPEQWRE